MNPRDVTELSWPALLIGPEGTIVCSASFEELISFRPRDEWELEQRIDVVLAFGGAVARKELPWRRRDAPFEERQIWHDRTAGKWHALRVHGTLEAGGLLLALDADEALPGPRESVERVLRALQEAVLAGRVDPSLHGVLHLLAELACELTGARYGAVGVLGRDGARLHDFIHVGLAEDVARRIGHWPEGKGLLGAVIREARTLRVADIGADPRHAGFPEHHPPMRSFLGVPIRMGERVLGNFYVSEKQGAPAFFEEDARNLEIFSAQAAMVVAFTERIEDEQRSLFRGLVEHASYGIAFVPFGAGAGEPFANAAARRMLGGAGPAAGRERAYAIVLPDGSPFPDDETPERRALRGETLVNVEALIVRPDERPLPVFISAASLVAEGQEPLGAVVVYQDISTLKELERLRAEFTAVVAHDMRGPVQALMLHIEALLERAAGEAAWVPLATLQSMKRSGEYLSRLIGDLLDVALLDSQRLPLDLQVFDVRDELHSLLLRLRPVLGERRVAVAAPAALEVLADPVRLDQIIGNLLENAARYSPAQAAIHVSVSRARGGVLVTVRDEGPGIPADELPYVFDRYYRGRGEGARRGGLGLGLYIARGLATLQGGTLHATSIVGAGTTFELWLPGPPAATT